MPSAFTMPPLAEHLPAGSFEIESSTDGMPTIIVPADHLVAVSRALHDTPALGFVVCVDITAADHFSREPRFDIVYHLVAPENRLRLRMRVHAGGAQPTVPTVSGIWAAANWGEREVIDMFGVMFAGHPDPARILMPDDWEGHPLRRDYPVQVNLPVRTYEPLQLTEEEFAENLQADRELRQRR